MKINILIGFYPVFLREMLIFKRRLFRLSYLFSSMVSPLLYLIAFGLGLGRRFAIEGVSYLTFLVPGIVAMSSMTNSYTWVASSISVGRLHFKTFEEYQVSPIGPSAIMLGEVVAGMIRGLFSSSLVLFAGVLFGGGFPKGLLFLPVWILNCLIFACFGVISGFLAKCHEDTATFSNFFILPMAFFCGTFFPVDRLPGFLKALIYSLPLTHASLSLRRAFLGQDVFLSSLGVMVIFFLICFSSGIIIIKRSNR